MRSYASDAGGEGVKRYDTHPKLNIVRCILCVLITVFGWERFHFVDDVRINNNVVVVMVVAFVMTLYEVERMTITMV